jgi:hypothetical protein
MSWWSRTFSTDLSEYQARDVSRAPIWNMTPEEVNDYWRRAHNQVAIMVFVSLVAVVAVYLGIGGH